MQFGKMHGTALAVLGVILLGIPGMLYMPIGKIPSGTASSSPVLQHKTIEVVRILGLAFLQCRIDGEALDALLGWPICKISGLDSKALLPDRILLTRRLHTCEDPNT